MDKFSFSTISPRRVNWTTVHQYGAELKTLFGSPPVQGLLAKPFPGTVVWSLGVHLPSRPYDVFASRKITFTRLYSLKDHVPESSLPWEDYQLFTVDKWTNWSDSYVTSSVVFVQVIINACSRYWIKHVKIHHKAHTTRETLYPTIHHIQSQASRQVNHKLRQDLNTNVCSITYVKTRHTDNVKTQQPTCVSCTYPRSAYMQLRMTCPQWTRLPPVSSPT